MPADDTDTDGVIDASVLQAAAPVPVDGGVVVVGRGGATRSQ
jgi:shikimate 5-dehydrogenase